MTPILKTFHPVLLLGALAMGACDFNIENPNSPNTIGENPNRSEVAAAATGLLVATRADVADWALKGAILGREAYRLDGADPRQYGELEHGPLDAGSRAFGGNHWGEEYAAIRSANDLLRVLPTAASLTAEEQSAVSGYAHTLQAYNFIIVLDSHTQDSIPIDVGTDVSAPPAPFVTRVQAFDHVVALLDAAATELAAGGAAFPFTFPTGFSGFNTPATFVLFNRALLARVEVYRGNYDAALTALTASFIDAAAALDKGVYMDFSAGPGDLTNALAIDPQTGENFGHPLLETQAKVQTDGTSLDRRFLTKLVKRDPRSLGTPQVLTSDLGWIRYPSPNSPIPLIKNEELILLRAEANIGRNDLASALPDINLVRQTSGGLPVYTGLVNQASLLTELLYNKRYSLMYEGGHSWIDYRRYGRTGDLAGLDRSGPPPDVIFATLPIPTAEVQQRQ
jgi:starch-binding outer membrane protein, SusD/RagB family